MIHKENNTLDYVVEIIKKLQNKKFEGDYVVGPFYFTDKDIICFEYLFKKKIFEVYINSPQKSSIEIDQLKNHTNQTVDIELNVGSVSNFFKSLEDFVSGNKFNCDLIDYYIDDISYRVNQSANVSVDNYNKNLVIVDFLKSISDNTKEFGNQLELFFYKSGKAVDLKINYNTNQLLELKFDKTNFKDDFTNSFNKEDKKILFINELIIHIEKAGNSYHKLIENWETLLTNYEKSYSLYISGFSFEKIKTSSNEHFQKLVDRIFETIGKASNYIFGIPIGYILLLNNFDYTGILWLKNIILLIIALIFFIMIWLVLFKNIEESIKAIEIEIDDFLLKIGNETELNDIHNKLESLKKIVLKKQGFKLSIVKVLTSIILILIILIYIFILFDLTIFLY